MPKGLPGYLPRSCREVVRQAHHERLVGWLRANGTISGTPKLNSIGIGPRKMKLSGRRPRRECRRRAIARIRAGAALLQDARAHCGSGAFMPSGCSPRFSIHRRPQASANTPSSRDGAPTMSSHWVVIEPCPFHATRLPCRLHAHSGLRRHIR